jgi:vacuolar-type H+-ATPase subunit H
MRSWGVVDRLRDAVGRPPAELEEKWPHGNADFQTRDPVSRSDFGAVDLPTVHEISPFIDEIEEMICSATTLPLTSKALVDQEHCLAALDLIRANWPLQVLEAERLLEREGQVLERAEKEAEEIRQRAGRQASLIVDQSQLVSMAEARAREIVEGAEQEADRILDRARHDVRDVYGGLERELDLLMRDIKELVGARLASLNR